LEELEIRLSDLESLKKWMTEVERVERIGLESLRILSEEDGLERAMLEWKKMRDEVCRLKQDTEKVEKGVELGIVGFVREMCEGTMRKMEQVVGRYVIDLVRNPKVSEFALIVQSVGRST
jgi:hypothetical protein